MKLILGKNVFIKKLTDKDGKEYPVKNIARIHLNDTGECYYVTLAGKEDDDLVLHPIIQLEIKNNK
jgi:hypothetical protein